MDPTVTGALIAGGAALIGFAASAWQNNRTIRASRQAARDQRLWDKKTDLYEDIGKALEKLEEVREKNPSTYHARVALETLYPRVQLYASDEIVSLFDTLDLLATATVGSDSGEDALIEWLADLRNAVRACRAAIRADLHDITGRRRDQLIRWRGL